ncbi:hypothetical protein PP724_22905 [Ralstonia solanacearum]|uniref:hypothetical protein n=1 Tax=Ralstonia solanacearum TaxID=305 RepID=UPI001FF88309|nr:hypothetical protein [Ralstonia solanacearum]MDC6237017.1 hypothetical protein [Ralstonia solanacearum]MDD7810580.1 hypothetical protein [Ralstonia solanacearum]
MQIASRIGTKFDAWLERLGYLNKENWHNPGSPFFIDRKWFFSDVAMGLFWLCVAGAVVYGVVRFFH